MGSVQIKLNEAYINLLNEKYVDNKGNPNASKVKPFINDIYSKVINSGVMLEFRSGWRSEAEVSISEENASIFVKKCINDYKDGEIGKNSLSKLINNIQFSFAECYKQDHVDILVNNAPIKIRRRHAEYLTPILEATSDVFTTKDIISMLIEGALESMYVYKPQSGKIENIPDKNLSEQINSQSKSIDLNKDIFYRGTNNQVKINSDIKESIGYCVATDINGHNFPFLLSKNDPVNRKISEFILDEFVD